MKNLKSLFAASVALVMSFGAFAAPTAKAVLKSGTLTFVYDSTSYGTKGTDWFSVAEAVEQSPSANPPWYGKSYTKVIFGDSFISYKPTHCGCWFYEATALTSVEGLRNLDVSAATSLCYMFENCGKLTELDLSTWNTTNVTDMSEMFMDCAKLTTIYASDRFSTAKVTQSADMFSGCAVLKGGNGTTCTSSKADKTYARIDGGTSSPGYFTRAKLATAILNTSAKTLTFYYDNKDHSGSGITVYYVDAAEAQAPNKNPAWWYQKTAYTKVIFDSTFADYRPKHCGSWFYQATELTDVSGLCNLNVSAATSLMFMFGQCSNASFTTLDLSGFDTSNVTNTYYMFGGCKNLKTIYATDKFTTAKVTNSTSMFNECLVLEGGNGTKYTSDKAKDKTYAKIDNSGQTGYFTAAPQAVLDTSAKTLTFYADGVGRASASVKAYSVMAAEAQNPASNPPWYGTGYTKAVFDKSFRAHKPKHCGSWFYKAESLTAIENLQNLDVSGATSFAHMFRETGLKTLDLSRFDTANVSSMYSMFLGSKSLTTIYVGDQFTTAKVSGTGGNAMFSECNSLVGGKGTAYATAKVEDVSYARVDGGPSSTTPGYFTQATIATAVYNSTAKTLTFYYDKKDHSSKGTVYYVDDAVNATSQTEIPWYAIKTSVEKIAFDSTFANYQPTSCKYWFYNFQKLTAIEGIRYLDVSKATTLFGMFGYCKVLETLDLSGFKTESLAGDALGYMFTYCEKLNTIYVTDGFTLDGVTATGQYCFTGCSNLKGGQGSTIASIGKTTVSCAKIDGGESNPGLFTGAPVAVYDETAKSLTFYNDALGHGGTGKTVYSLLADAERSTTQPAWYEKQSGITSVAFDESFKTYQPPHCIGWFYYMEELKDITGLANLDVSAAEKLQFMFMDCVKLTTLDLTGFDTANVQNYVQMFWACKNLKTIYVSNKFVIKSGANCNNMFRGCTVLVGGNGTEYDSTVVDGTYAKADLKSPSQKGYFTYPLIASIEISTRVLHFYCDGTLGTCKVDESAYDASQPWLKFKGAATAVDFDSSCVNYRPTSCYGWFENFTKLTAVGGLKYLDLSQCEYLAFMFYNCAKLTSLDISTFDTSKVQEFDSMFEGCTSLKTIKAADPFSLAAKTSAADMFSGCTALVGGNGTTYSAEHVDASYAHVDAVGNPGYFTGELAAVAVYDDATKTLTFYYDALGHSGDGKTIYEVSSSLAPMTKPDWSACAANAKKVVFDKSFAAYQPTHCGRWFDCFDKVTEFTGLKYLDVSKATSFAGMFNGCSSVTTLDLSTFDTANVLGMNNMFAGCKNLTTIYASDKFVTTKVTNGANMFKDAVKLPNYNALTVDHTKAFIGKDGYLSETPLADTARAVLSTDGKTLTFVYDQSHHYGYTSFEVIEDTTPSWYSHVCCGTVTKVVFDATFKNFQPKTLSNWFYHFAVLTAIEGIENLDTSAASSMAYLFKGCTTLAKVDLTGFDTANVTDMRYMFGDCVTLTALDLSSFDTAKVESMFRMFDGCTQLKTIYVRRFSTASVSGLEGHYMFLDCTALKGGAGTVYDAAKTDFTMAQIDYGADDPGYFTREPVAVFNATTKTLTFYADGADHSSEGKVYSLATENERVPDSGKPVWWSDCEGVVTKVVFHYSFADFRPKHCGAWFWAFDQLEEVEGLSNLDVSEATSLYYMFCSCGKLTQLDLRTFKTANVTDMTFLFNGCTALKTIYASEDFDVSAVTKEAGMFTDCSMLEGSEGTKCDGIHDIGKEYARIDGGTSKPGYFSEQKLTVIEIAKPMAIADLVYTATEQTGVTYDEQLQVSGTLKATEAGSYSATFELPADTSTETYQWVGGGTESRTQTWSIKRRSVDDSTVSFAAIPDQTYTGSAITPAVTMTFAGATKTLGTDYSVAYSDNIDVGTATAMVTGNGNFTGSKALSFEIVEPAPIQHTVTFNANGGTCGETSRQVEHGKPIGSFPDVTRLGYNYVGWYTASEGGEKVNESTAIDADVTFYVHWQVISYQIDYNLGGGTNHPENPENYTVEDEITLKEPTKEGFIFKGWTPDNGVIAKGSTGVKTFTATWEVSPSPKTEVLIEKPVKRAESLFYTGEAQSCVTGYDSRLITSGFVSATDQGAYKAIFALPPETETQVFKWADGTTANVEIEWCIQGRDVNDSGVTFAAIPDQYYTGSEIKPSITMTYAGVVRTEGTDYTLTYEDNVNVGTAKAIVTGKGNFTEVKTLTFNIVAKPKTEVKIEFPTVGGPFVYTGTPICCFTAYDAQLVLTDVAVATNAGNYVCSVDLPDDTETQTFKWENGSVGAIQVNWTIEPRPVTDEGVAFAEIADQYYTGSAIEPTVAMTYGGQVCARDTDYTVEYADNVEIGTATVTVTGKGNFSGTAELTFEIVEVPVGTSVVTFDKTEGAFVTEPTRSVENGTAVGALPITYSMSKEFKGWYTAATGGEAVTAERIVTGDVTFYAQWQDPPADSHYIFFSDHGGKITEYVRFVEDGKAIGALPEATRDGYDFDGWFTEAEGGDAITAEKVITADLIAHAQWTKKEKKEVVIPLPKPIAGLVYTGAEQKGFAAYDERIKFVSGKEAATDAGAYTAWFKLPDPTETEKYVWDNDHYGTESVGWSIAACSVADSRVTFDAIEDSEYAGAASEPEVKMSFNGAVCVAGTDYEVAYSNNAKVGTGYAIVTGKGNFSGEKKLAFKILPVAATVGEYLAYDLEEDLGVVLDEIDGVKTDYRAGDKVVVKIEGLAKGLKLAQDKTTSKWLLSGVPTETARYANQPMFARVTVTYKDKTKASGGKVEKLYLLPLDVARADVPALGAGVVNGIYEPIDIAELWPEVADAKTSPSAWTFKGWPAGILYNNTAAVKVWTVKIGGSSVERSVDPYEVYGIPTKAGTYTITATHKYKPEGATAVVSETLTATLTVWADEAEKAYRYVDQVGVATTNTTIGADVKSVAGLPTGLKFVNGSVAGTPTKAGVFTVTLTPTAKGAAKTTFLWLVNKGANEGILSKIDWKATSSTVSVMQGVVQTWNVDVPTGAKVTVSGLPAGLKFALNKSTGLWTLSGTPTKNGNFVVVFKTVLNGETVTERISIVVNANEWTGNWYGVQKDSCTDASLNVLVNVAANGTVKLTLAEGVEKTTVKTSVTAKNLENDGRTAVFSVMQGKTVVRTITADFAAGTFAIEGAIVADLCETAQALASDKSVRTYVLDEISDGETNAYAYVTATYDKKKNAFALAGKLWDGTAVKGTAYPLAKATENGGNYLSSVLLTDKEKNAVLLELSDDGTHCRVRENGQKIAIGPNGTTPWYDSFEATELKGKPFDSLVNADNLIVLATYLTGQEEVVLPLTAAAQATKLAANGLAKITITDDDGWKWVCEMLPIDNETIPQFRGLATGTKKGQPTQVAPVWSK